ncbi:hypothetical protein JRI60_43550 [Archangium violaceum]|uniref:hypothetical protein n=1 Tax=Archangium violaceum TaxID=83451 RepID=UPI0019505548|nr:hypothetical protein [Archangium violaceum]QRN95851.1 hypothetical protein JRI60_43550 [Archangium violaceum]
MQKNGDKSLKAILNNDDLKKLRQDFKEQTLLDSARTGIGQKLPDSMGFINTLEEQFYKPANQSQEQYRELARQRESQLITLFLVYARGQGFFLGIHFYWGLMMGLSLSDVARQVLLAGMYGGIQVLNAGQMTLERTLLYLKRMVDDGKTTTLDILSGITTELPTPLPAPR